MERLSLPARRWVLALFCAAFVLIAWWVPYICTDDLQWGMDQGLRWWLQGLLNGRYVGNGFAVVMCRSQLAKTLIMGLVMFALPLAMAAVAAPRGERVPLPLFFAGCALLLIMPRVMWLETYGWVSAFGNYVVPTLLFFLWLLILDHVSLTRSRLGLWSALLLALTLAMGLFVENLTVLFLGGSLLLALYSLWDRALRLPFFACLLGSALGAAVMFLNGVFADLTGTGSALNGLRQLTFAPGAGLLEMARGVLGWYFGRLLPISFLRGVHMALPLGILIACTFWRGKAKALALTGVLPLVCYFLFSGSQVYNPPFRAALAA